MLSKQRLLVVFLLVVASLACGTNTPVARVAPPRPTRTPFPTFTVTPIPPTPAPTSTPEPTAAVVQAAALPPTDTPPPPTDIPAPTDTPVPPTPVPVPPTNTPPPPPPTPVPESVASSPLATPAPESAGSSPVATPTAVPEPDTPPGRYELEKMDWDSDCANVGVIGRVLEKGDDRPVQWVSVEITGADDDVKGPFIGKTNADGRYNIFIGALEDVEGVELQARIVGPGVTSEDEPKWTVSDSCHDGDANQVMELEWYMKR